MTTDWKALCAQLAENVRYLLDCVADGDSDPVAIAECVQRLGATRLLLSQPEPEGLTDEEILNLSEEHCVSYTRLDGSVTYPYENDMNMKDDVLFFARALIAADRARWGRPAVQPVPVSERLPGPEDCMDEGWAWFYTPRGDWIKAVLPVSPAYTHWLPHYALPVPTFTETP